MQKIILKPGREKSVIKKHPWVFSGAIERVDEGIGTGETVKILDSRGKFLAYGAYSPSSKIRARIWSWNEGDEIDAEFLRRKISESVGRREGLVGLGETNAKRLVYSEADGLPGLIVDQYDKVLACQFLTAGMKFWQETVVKILVDLIKPKVIFERSDVEVASVEGGEEKNKKGVVYGKIPEKEIVVEENGIKYLVGVENGQKTGFYLDQRDNRLFLRSLVKDKRVLDCFSYTGGFALNALKGGAGSVVAVDSSKMALEILEKNWKLNKMTSKKCEVVEADVFEQLRKYKEEKEKFDVIVLDPPKLVKQVKDLNRSSRAYKDINRLALGLLNPGGYLLTFSCSGAVTPEIFQTILAWSALDAGVDARVIKKFSQGTDHPIALNCPETEYLKGLLVRKI